MSEQYDDSFIGTGEAGETWVDDEGNTYTDEEAAWLVQSGEYEVAQPLTHPDNANEYGIRERDLWPTDQTERSATRHAYMLRMLKERNG